MKRIPARIRRRALALLIDFCLMLIREASRLLARHRPRDAAPPAPPAERGEGGEV